MRWTVVYKTSASNELAHIWNNAPDKQAIADASDWADVMLLTDPEKRGRSLNGDRFLVVPPLCFVFTVSPPDCLVTVLHVFEIKD